MMGVFAEYSSWCKISANRDDFFLKDFISLEIDLLFKNKNFALINDIQFCIFTINKL